MLLIQLYLTKYTVYVLYSMNSAAEFLFEVIVLVSYLVFPWQHTRWCDSCLGYDLLTHFFKPFFR